MERAGRPHRTFPGARARRPFPGLSRAALWLALACALAPFLPDLLLAGANQGKTLTAITAAPLPIWLASACLLAAVAWLLARGVTRPVTIRVDGRCLYLAGKRRERRIPKWMIEDVAVSPRRCEVWLLLSSGQKNQLLLKTPEDARKLAAALPGRAA